VVISGGNIFDSLFICDFFLHYDLIWVVWLIASYMQINLKIKAFVSSS